MTATLPGDGAPHATFGATATTGPASGLAIHAGGGQSAPVSTSVATPPSVIVTDGSGNPVVGNPDGDGVLPTGDPVTHLGGSWQYESQRARPGATGQSVRPVGYFADPGIEVVHRGHMQDQWMIGRAAFDSVDPRDCRG